MARYPVMNGPVPWTNVRELGQVVNIDGVDIAVVVNINPVVGNVILGEAGFEAESPYLLVPSESISAMGDLHGKEVIVDSENYVIRNVHPKHETNLTRLVLDAR